MYVNGFWLGVLVTLIVEIFLIIIAGVIRAIRGDDYEEYQPSEEEFREVLEEMTGKKFKVVEKNGYLVGEIIEEEEEGAESK